MTTDQVEREARALNDWVCKGGSSFLWLRNHRPGLTSEQRDAILQRSIEMTRESMATAQAMA